MCGCRVCRESEGVDTPASYERRLGCTGYAPWVSTGKCMGVCLRVGETTHTVFVCVQYSSMVCGIGPLLVQSEVSTGWSAVKK